MGLAAAAFDPQAVCPHRGQMSAACHEGHVRAGFRESGPEGSSDATGADDGYAHRLCLLIPVRFIPVPVFGVLRYSAALAFGG